MILRIVAIGALLMAGTVLADDDDASPADDDSSPDDDDNFTPHWSAVTIGQAGYLHHGAWGSSASDVYVVGANLCFGCCPLIMHYDGAAWTTMSLPPGFDRNEA